MLLLRRLGRDQEAEAAFHAGKATAGWRTSWQMPAMFNPALRSQPWWDPQQFATAVALRRQATAIRAEAEALLTSRGALTLTLTLTLIGGLAR